MVAFGGIKRLQGIDCCYNRLRKGFGLLELLDISRRNFFLIRRGEENGRAVLRAGVRPLTVQFCRVVRDCKKYFQYLA